MLVMRQKTGLRGDLVVLTAKFIWDMNLGVVQAVYPAEVGLRLNQCFMITHLGCRLFFNHFSQKMRKTT